MEEASGLQARRPRCVQGCTIERQQVSTGASVHILKDRDGGCFMKLSDEGLFVWQSIDGEHTVRDLCVAYAAKFQRLAPADVLHALARLLEAGFITFDDADADAPLPDRALPAPRWLSLCVRYWSIDGLDTRVTALHRPLHGLYAWPIQALLLLVAATGALAFAWRWSEAPLPSSSAWPIWAASLMIHLVLHEAAHALTCKHFGRAVRRAGIGWYYFVPVAFVDTSDVWPAPRRQRVLVSAAGPYSNLVLAGIAALAAQMPLPDVATQALWSFRLMGYGLALVNLNPLLELDGYYILMDLLEAPNLRARALACLGAALRGQAGAAIEPRMHKVALAFGTACVIYGIAASMSLLLAYHAVIGQAAAAWMPQTYAQTIGWGLAAVMSLLILCRLLDGLRGAELIGRFPSPSGERLEAHFRFWK